MHHNLIRAEMARKYKKKDVTRWNPLLIHALLVIE